MEPAKVHVEKIEIKSCGEGCYLKTRDWIFYCVCDWREHEIIRCHNWLQDVLASESPTLEAINEIHEKVKRFFPWSSGIERNFSAGGWGPESERLQNLDNVDFSRFGVLLAPHGNPMKKSMEQKKFIQNFYDFFYVRDVYKQFYPGKADSTRATWGSDQED